MKMMGKLAATVGVAATIMPSGSAQAIDLSCRVYNAPSSGKANGGSQGLAVSMVTPAGGEGRGMAEA
jgi:hypothetical protein